MTVEELLIKIAEILENLNIPYMVTGGFAVSVWGRPRFTADIDIVIELYPQKISQLEKALLAIDKDVYVSKQAIEEAVKKGGEFNFIHPQTGIKVDFWVEKSIEKYHLPEYRESRQTSLYEKIKLQRRVAKEINGKKVYFISPEDLILSKLIWYKESQSNRHIEDIKSILEISKVDLEYIKTWAEQQSTLAVLENLIKETHHE